ncbi:glycosyltransferase [Caldibacillus lycopersici]|uniref:Glycosyltransferase n=1 Tax=Perspicuibacillus lycopersici TaxID=1325689 RepID=A0AAE3LLV7_9BACI|nr:glycosyltransferase [Perspicuibacillus lycopersici]MCU9612326.1 glycosyltransferase [Perspicuibacillus lycopersici]
MKQPLISVIVPIYKVENYLNRCLESIVNQTYNNLEIILVDDGSPDRCPEICNQWAERDSRIIVIHQPNGGLSKARNSGLRIAKGDYIGFVDSDDWILPDMYEFLLNLILVHNADISHCSFYHSNGKNLHKGHGTGKKFNGNNFESIKECLKLEKFILSVWNKLYKRDVLNGVFFEDGRYYEDTLFNFWSFKNANKTVYDGEPKYFYFTRDDSIVKSPFSKKELDVIYSTEKLCKLTSKYYPDLLEYAEKKNIIECLVLINNILSSQDSIKYLDEYESTMKKLKIYAGNTKTRINSQLHWKYKWLLTVLNINEKLFVFILTNYLSRKRSKK